MKAVHVPNLGIKFTGCVLCHDIGHYGVLMSIIWTADENDIWTKVSCQNGAMTSPLSKLDKWNCVPVSLFLTRYFFQDAPIGTLVRSELFCILHFNCINLIWTTNKKCNFFIYQGPLQCNINMLSIIIRLFRIKKYNMGFMSEHH